MPSISPELVSNGFFSVAVVAIGHLVAAIIKKHGGDKIAELDDRGKLTKDLLSNVEYLQKTNDRITKQNQQILQAIYMVSGEFQVIFNLVCDCVEEAEKMQPTPTPLLKELSTLKQKSEASFQKIDSIVKNISLL